MAYSATTQPDTYMNGYSFVPIRLNDSDATTVENYKYIINITYNELPITTSESYNFDGNIHTQLTFATAHEYAIGDILLLEDSSDLYSGYYIVLLTPSTTTIVVDLTLGQAMTGTVATQNVVKYKVNPDPDFEAKIDLSNTLKDFITQNLSDSDEIYSGSNTVFNYDLKLGYEGNAIFNFDDNIFQSGNAGFVATGLTATTQVQFEVGDQIVIQQDLYSWDYTDNYFTGGLVGYTGSTAHGFTSGDTITVTGQITNPSYNGDNTVKSATTYGLLTYSSFLSSTPAEPGTLYGVITPEYNTTAIITNIVYSAGTGVIVTTDIGFGQSTSAIGGSIKHADGRYITVLDSLEITGLSVYNSYVNQQNYSIDEFDKYVAQFRTASENNISTVLGNVEKYRIERSTKSWLLAHNYDVAGNPISPRVTFYDSSDSIISQMKYINTEAYDDFYFPVGINQLTGNTNTLLNSGSELSAISSSVSYYKVEFERLASVASNPVWFELNTDCSRYELYHLMWKDARGSWLSYPFKYISRDKTDVDRKNYYQTNGNWSNNTFDFDSFGRGEKSYFARSRDKVTLNSGWITEFENDVIKDLMQSASVYIQTPENVLIACTIDNKSIEFGKNINEQVFQYKLDVVYSNDEIRL